MNNKIEQRTVTIPLEEYIVMKENAEQLTKAINERKIISLGSGMSNDWIRYYITDEHTAVANVQQELIDKNIMYGRVKKELNELQTEAKRHYAIEEKRYVDLWRTFNEYTSASIWTRIMRVFNKQY
jgi:hypothetical protein